MLENVISSDPCVSQLMSNYNHRKIDKNLEILQLDMRQGLYEVVEYQAFLIKLAQRNKNLTIQTVGVVRNNSFCPRIGLFWDAIP